jgi:hypothetical protein
MPHYVNYIAVMLCVAIAPCYAQSTENIGQVFSKYQTEGTIVLSFHSKQIPPLSIRQNAHNNALPVRPPLKYCTH